MSKEVCTAVLQRWDVLDRLREAATDKRTLVEDVDCSRSTVNRAIRELESVDMVEYVDGEYEVTPLGETVASRFEEVMETVELRTQFKPFLQWVPEDEFDLELQYLRDAELFLPKPGDPYAMINRHVELVSRTTDHKCVLPVIGLHALTAGYEQVLENGAHVELVLAPEAAETLQFDPDYAELTEEMAFEFVVRHLPGTVHFISDLARRKRRSESIGLGKHVERLVERALRRRFLCPHGRSIVRASINATVTSSPESLSHPIRRGWSHDLPTAFQARFSGLTGRR